MHCRRLNSTGYPPIPTVVLQQSMPFSPSVSPDKYDLLLPLPHGARRSPRSRLYAYLIKDGLPTIGTEGYTGTDESQYDSDELIYVDHQFGNQGYAAVQDCLSRIRDGSFVVPTRIEPMQSSTSVSNQTGKTTWTFPL